MDDMNFSHMTKAQIWEWAEADENAGLINERDRNDDPLLYVAVREASLPFICWLVEERCADVNVPEGSLLKFLLETRHLLQWRIISCQKALIRHPKIRKI